VKVRNADANRVAPVTRRIAVALALREIEAQRRGASFSEAARTALVDDLCALSHAVDAADTTDAALACAAADPDRATSIAARVAYAARLLLRAAWLEQTPKFGDGARGAGLHRYADLHAALEALHAFGVSCAQAPRAMLALLARPSVHLPGSFVLRLVAAVHAHEATPLVQALSMSPFDLDAGELAAVLSVQTGPPRGTFAAAIPSMTGNGARERAIAALEVLDALLECSASSQALSRSAQAARKALAATHPAVRFEQDDALDACIAAADRIFDAAAIETKVGDRARLVSRSLERMELDGITLVPFVGSFEAEATIGFEDAASPVDTDKFARALGADPARFVSFAQPGAKATVAAALAGALAQHALHRGPATRGRAMPPGDPPTNVVSPGMVFSASRLNGYVKCPRRFFYEYLCETLEDPGSLHATYGRVVHDALEMLHREIRVPARHEPSYILDRLLRDLDAAFGAARSDFTSQLEYESSRWRARRMAEQYVRWLCAEAKRAPMEIAGVELLERRRLGEYDFIGYIDRVDRPEGGGPVTIYDYKTGRIDDDAKAYLAKVRSGDEAQLALYYAMRRAAGDDVKRIALVSVRDPRDEVWILALDVDSGDPSAASVDRDAGVARAVCSPADLEASLQALLRRCDLLAKEGVERFAPGEDPPCGFCEYALACRDRPLHGERSFVR
jgi:hypothetical protein